MSRILKANQTREHIHILHPQTRHYKIEFQDGEPTKYIDQDNNESVIPCLNCINPRCMEMHSSEIECFSFPKMSHEMNKKVCVADAITVGKDSICIDESKCIGCGLCAYRCPVGAIHFEDGKAKLNSGNSFPTFVLSLECDSDSVKRQKEFLKKAVPMFNTGVLRKESDNVMKEFYRKIKRMSQENQNLLVRNALISLGCQVALSRHGDVYSRMDGFYENENQMGVLEIETGQDVLSVSRALLDDVAVVNSRYDIVPATNHPLAVVLSLPNKRTDYWQVVKDIGVITNLHISTLTIGAIFLFLWNCEEVSDFDQFYIDVDNLSIREMVEKELDRKVNITEGLLGVLENSK